MRVLSQPRLDLITAIVAEGQFPGITAGILEKDEHLTDALKAIFCLQFSARNAVFLRRYEPIKGPCAHRAHV